MQNQKPDYYINRRRKIIDFLIGFVMIAVTAWLVVAAYSWLVSKIDLPSWVSQSVALILIICYTLRSCRREQITRILPLRGIPRSGDKGGYSLGRSAG